MWCSALNYRTGRNSVDFKGKSDDTIYNKKLSVILRIRSANVGENIRWKGMYAYSLNRKTGPAGKLDRVPGLPSSAP